MEPPAGWILWMDLVIKTFFLASPVSIRITMESAAPGAHAGHSAIDVFHFCQTSDAYLCDMDDGSGQLIICQLYFCEKA